MTGNVGWFAADVADVPDDDTWLSPREQDVVARLVVPPRRADWRLGRWVAKRSLLAYRHGADDIALPRLSVLAAPDGAPEAWLDDQPLDVALSLSHRAGLGVAAVGPADVRIGIDLELVEPRRPEFLADWFGEDERATLVGVSGGRRDRAVVTMWALKEAAAKALREGLRLDVRDLRTTVVGQGDGPDRWQPAEVRHADVAHATDSTHSTDSAGSERRFAAWVRDLDAWVVAVAAPRGLGAPRWLGSPSEQPGR